MQSCLTHCFTMYCYFCIIICLIIFFCWSSLAYNVLFDYRNIIRYLRRKIYLHAFHRTILVLMNHFTFGPDARCVELGFHDRNIMWLRTMPSSAQSLTTPPHLLHSSILNPHEQTWGDPEQGSEDRNLLPS